MLALSFSMLLIMSLVGSLSFKSITTDLIKLQNLATCAMVLGNVTAGLILCALFVDQQVLVTTLINLSVDYRIYLCVTLECVGLIAMRQNYLKNGNNVTAINFCMFFSLALVPILSYFASDALGFADTIKVNYRSQSELWLFTGILTTLVFVYFYDKIKGHINDWFYLLLTPLILSNTMFISSKLMQTYNPYVVGTFIFIITLFIYAGACLLKAEHKCLARTHVIPLTRIFIGGTLTYPLNVTVVQIIAVEFIVLLKRTSQIISGVVTDKIYGNKNTVNKKDVVVIALVLATGLSLYYMRG
jgi:hypothetical protein